MNPSRTSRACGVSSAAMTVALWSSPAAAQDLPPEEPPSAQRETDADIIVTAQRREQRLQDVPIAVSAFDGEQLRRSSVRDIRDLTILTPSLVVTSTQSESSSQAQIRGIGTTSENPGLESSVGVFIDGVYRSRNGVALTDLGEIERIEVLRGPQGTLFGRNTSAGALNIVTRQPSFEFTGFAEAEYGDFEHVRLSAGVSGPLVADRLAARIDANYASRDGFVRAEPIGRLLNDRNRWLVRGQLLWTPSDAVRVRLIADFSSRDEQCCTGTLRIAGPTALAVNAVGGTLSLDPQPFDRIVGSNRLVEDNVDQGGVSAEATIDFGGATLTSVTSWRDWRREGGLDADFSSADLAYRPTDGGYADRLETFTQELRLNGRSGRLDWLVGAFYSDETLERDDTLLAGAGYEPYIDLLLGGPGVLPLLTGLPPGSILPNGSGQRDFYRQEAQSLAFFTHNTFNVTDRLAVTLGLRWTREDKSLVADFQTNAPGCQVFEFLLGPNLNAPIAPQFAPLLPAAPAVCTTSARSSLDAIGYDQERTEEEFSGTANIQYRFSPAVMAYASFSRGHKAGGFNLERSFANIAAPDTSFPAELVDAYELGLKTTLFDRSLTFNMAAFRQDIRDYQLLVFNGLFFTVVSVPDVRSQGLELEASWRTPLEGLRLSGGLTYLDAEFGSGSAFTGPALAPIAGLQLPNAPELTLAGSLSFERPIGNSGWGMMANLDVRHMTERNTAIFPEAQHEATTIVNGRIGIFSPNEWVRLELWGRNLFDEEYRQIDFPTPAQPGSFSGYLGDPRTYGVTARFQF